MFSLQKKYTDVLSKSGTVAIIYDVKVNVLGIPINQSMVEVFKPNGEHTIHNNSPKNFKCESIEGDKGKHKPTKDIEWSVKSAKSKVSLELGQSQLSGMGYQESIVLSKMPRFLGIKEIHWGRIHRKEGSLIFNHVEFKDGKTWSSILANDEDNKKYQVKGFDYDRSKLKINFHEHTICLHKQRILHDGDVIDQKRFPKFADKCFAHFLSKQGHETRYLSVTDQGDWAIHERVNFN